MREIAALAEAGVPPPREVILRAQGVPPHHEVPESVEELVREAQSLYRDLAEPRGMFATITLAEFLDLYQGEGENADPSPLPDIVRRADHLALFAATLGGSVSDRIRSLFVDGNPALGYALDTIASERADAAADLLAQRLRDALIREGRVGDEVAVLSYCPGYCGWHVTGQRRLFAYLGPDAVGITLNESCLMTPLKSVSGVLVAGAPQAHVFDNAFDFCLDCATWECRDRIASLF